MYNRYIPQPDGSFQRNRICEPKSEPRPIPSPPPPQPPPCAITQPPPCAITQPPCNTAEQTVCPPPHRCPSARHKNQEGFFSFLKNLLPRELDTGDLMIILLLLLMAGDNEEGRNNALLTLALYFLL